MSGGSGCCRIGGTVVPPATVTPPGGITVEAQGEVVGVFTTINFDEGFSVVDEGGGVVAVSVLPQLTPMFLPEQWAENNVRLNLVNHVMDCQVSTSFDTFKVITSGSITAASTRLSQTITAGTLAIVVTINGVATALTLTHTNVSNPNGGIATAAVGAITYVPGDLIGVFISTNNTLAPLSNDIEAMLQVTE